MNELTRAMVLYSEITADYELARLGPPFSYHYSDTIKSNVLAQDIIEIDVKSAFPTICKFYFGEDHQFVKNIFNIENKLDRNIYIATTLKTQSDKDDGKYLNELNLWSKILVLGYIYSKYDDIFILQFIKDGAIIKGKIKDSFNQNHHQFLDFITKHEVIFHEHHLPYYIRFNKTTIIKQDNNISIKGKYKRLPTFINETLIKFFNGDIYDSTLLANLKKIYSNDYFNILLNGKMKDYIDLYYSIDDKYLDKHENLNTIDRICPKMYLITIIYPLLSLFRLKQNI